MIHEKTVRIVCPITCRVYVTSCQEGEEAFATRDLLRIADGDRYLWKLFERKPHGMSEETYDRRMDYIKNTKCSAHDLWLEWKKQNV